MFPYKFFINSYIYNDCYRATLTYLAPYSDCLSECFTIYIYIYIYIYILSRDDNPSKSNICRELYWYSVNT